MCSIQMPRNLTSHKVDIMSSISLSTMVDLTERGTVWAEKPTSHPTNSHRLAPHGIRASYLPLLHSPITQDCRLLSVLIPPAPGPSLSGPGLFYHHSVTQQRFLPDTMTQTTDARTGWGLCDGLGARPHRSTCAASPVLMAQHQQWRGNPGRLSRGRICSLRGGSQWL